MIHDVIIIDMPKEINYSRFDTVILGSTFLTSIVTFLIYIGFSLYKFFRAGIWIKSLTTCQVFNIFCSDNFLIKIIGNLEALLFVSLVFGLYFAIHLLLTKK